MRNLVTQIIVSLQIKCYFPLSIIFFFGGWERSLGFKQFGYDVLGHGFPWAYLVWVHSAS